MSVYTQTVAADGGWWRFDCDCIGTFASDGWPSEPVAQLRADRHELEHDTGLLMPPEQVTWRGGWGPVKVSLRARWSVEAEPSATPVQSDLAASWDVLAESGTLDASWESMVAGMTFTPANAAANYTTMQSWYRANTGVESADGDLTPSGTISTTAVGQVIEGLLVSGTIFVHHDDVTIRNCKITNGGGTAAIEQPFSALGDVDRLTIEKVSCIGTGAAAEYTNGVHLPYIGYPSGGGGPGNGLRGSQIYVSGFGGGYRLGYYADDRLDYSMVEAIRTHPGSHNTGVSFRGGVRKDVWRCWIEGSTSSGLSLYPDSSPILDARVEQNLFDGGSYSFRGGDPKTYGDQTTAQVVDNKFTRAHTFGAKAAFDLSKPDRVWSGNAYLDGEVIP